MKCFALSNTYAVSAELGLIQIDELAQLAEHIEGHFARDLTSFTAAIEQAAATQKLDEEYQKFCEAHSDDHWRLSEIFPNMVRRALFVTTMSSLEYSMGSLCDSIRRQRKLLLNPDQLRDQGAIRFKTYLQAICGFPFPADSLLWQKVQDLIAVRNCIVHNNGGVKGLDKERRLREIVARSGGSLKLNQFDELYVEAVFCRDAIASAKGLLDKLRQGTTDYWQEHHGKERDQDPFRTAT